MTKEIAEVNQINLKEIQLKILQNWFAQLKNGSNDDDLDISLVSLPDHIINEDTVTR